MGSETRERQLERREMLMLGGATIVGLCATRAFGTGGRSGASAEARLLRKFGRTLCLQPGMKTLGLVYARACPAEAQVDEAARLILGSLNHSGADIASRSGGMAEIRRLLSTRVRQDFEESELVMLDGWALSRTEARLLVLATVDEGRRS